VFAFNYGSHNEIHNAVMKLHNKNLKKSLSFEEIADNFYSYFQYPDIPYPDLLLRTAGEQRISNFLLYQLAYTELIFIDTLWPDVNQDILDNVLLEFKSRNRTYGKN
jgi:undecaprenyl diphosphate synthase